MIKKLITEKDMDELVEKVLSGSDSWKLLRNEKVVETINNLKFITEE